MKKYRNQIRMKQMLPLVLTFVLAITMIGCGKKKQEDVAQDIQSLQEATGTDTEQSQGNDILEEAVSFDISCSGGSEVSVENLTFVDETDGSGRVYELENKPITDDEIKELAEGLFDDGEYEVITPYLVASDSELEDERVFYETEFNCANYDEELSKMCRQNYWMYVMDELERRQNGDITREVYTRKEGQILCPVEPDTQTQVAPVWDIVRHGEAGILRGKVNGEYWMMEVLNHHLYWSDTENRTEIHIYSLNMPQIYENVSLDSVNDAIYGENLSDQAECRKQTEMMLDVLGFGSPELLHTTSNAFMTNTPMGGFEVDTKLYQDGYVFNYAFFEQDNQPKLAYLDAACITKELNSWEFENPNMYVPQPSLYVRTYQNQVQEIYILSYMPERKELSEKSEMLSREVVIQKMKSEIETIYNSNYAENPTSETIKNPRMVLKYMLLGFEDDNHIIHYNMMPVWIFEVPVDVSYKDNDLPTALFGICAIDGSLVELDNTMRSLRGWYY